MTRDYIISAAAIAFVLGMAVGGASHPANRCQEDEVYAVQRDTNPAHGLTWACESREDVTR